MTDFSFDHAYRFDLAGSTLLASDGLNNKLTWRTDELGVEGGRNPGQDLDLPAGAYAARTLLEFASPPERRTVQARCGLSRHGYAESESFTVGHDVYPDPDNSAYEWPNAVSFARTVDVDDGWPFFVELSNLARPDVVDPADLQLVSAQLYLTRLA